MRKVKKAKSSIKVFLVDDHELIRCGLRRLLELQDDIEVVGDCADAEEALSQVERLSPDVVLMDIKMPGTDGLEATRRLKRKQPTCKVIMLTLYEQYVAECIKAGADGYLLKDTRWTELTKAIRQVHQSTHPLDERGGFVQEVDLAIRPPADTAQMLRVVGQVEKTLDASIQQTIGSQEWGTLVTLLLKPAPLGVLMHKLRSIPNIDKVEEQGEEVPPPREGFLKKSKTPCGPRTSARRRISVTLK